MECTRPIARGKELMAQRTVLKVQGTVDAGFQGDQPSVDGCNLKPGISNCKSEIVNPKLECYLSLTKEPGIHQGLLQQTEYLRMD